MEAETRRVEQLEHVVAVTRYGSLRRSSEQLHLSQPALSESVSRLEKELGVVLLGRRRSGARISAQGLELLPHLEAVLEAVARLRSAAGTPTGGERVLRVGTVSAATSTLLTPALRRLAERHPTSRVEVANVQHGARLTRACWTAASTSVWSTSWLVMTLPPRS
jgi:DNA-binding transcriptional LysR family regulator